MRGLLRITSARSPYLRAGLSWPLHRAVDVDIRDLDGPRLVELVTDPVLTVLFGDDDGEFRPAPEFVGEITPEAAQLAIDAIASEMPERVAQAPVLGSAQEVLAQVDRLLAAAGFLTVGDLLAAYAGLKVELTDANAEGDDFAQALKAAGFDSVALALAAYAASRERVTELETDVANAKTAAARVTELEAEIAALKAAKPAAGHKPKTPATT